MNSYAPISALMTVGEVTRTIGSRVRLRREEKSLSREALSKLSGVSVPTISRLELKGTATLLNLIKLLHALGSIEGADSFLKPPKFSSLDEFLKSEGSK